MTTITAHGTTLRNLDTDDVRTLLEFIAKAEWSEFNAYIELFSVELPDGTFDFGCGDDFVVIVPHDVIERIRINGDGDGEKFY